MKLLVITLLLFVLSQAILAQPDPTPLTESVEGTVTDYLGVPWSDRKVRLRSEGEILRTTKGGLPEMVDRTSATDEQGRYRFTQLPEGRYQITLLGTEGGLIEETKTTGFLFDGKPAVVDFGVEIGEFIPCQFTIGGVVYGPDGKPFEGAKITVINGFNQRKLPTATTDKGGSFSISICGFGQYVVLLNTPTFEIQTKTVVIWPRREYVFQQTDFRIKPLPDDALRWRKR